jgi:hypothetical protein
MITEYSWKHSQAVHIHDAFKAKEITIPWTSHLIVPLGGKPMQHAKSAKTSEKACMANRCMNTRFLSDGNNRLLSTTEELSSREIAEHAMKIYSIFFS